MGAVHHDVVRVHTRGAYMVTYAPSIAHACDISMVPMGLDVAMLAGWRMCGGLPYGTRLWRCCTDGVPTDWDEWCALACNELPDDRCAIVGGHGTLRLHF